MTRLLKAAILTALGFVIVIILLNPNLGFFIIGRNGSVLDTAVGSLSKGELEAKIRRI